MALERPAGNASKKDWAAYARELGLDPGDRSRDEIIALVDADQADAKEGAEAQDAADKPTYAEEPELPWAKILSTDTPGVDYIVAVRVGPYATKLVDVSPYPGWQGPAQLSVSLSDAVSIRDALTLALKTFGVE